MIITTAAQAVRVRHRLTRNSLKNDLFIEIDDLKGDPVAAFSTIRNAAEWLQESGFDYVQGTSGIWVKSKKKTAGSIVSEPMTSMAIPSQPKKTPKKSFKQYALTKLDISKLICLAGLLAILIWLVMED